MSRNKRRNSNRLAMAFMLLVAAAAGTVALALYVRLTPANKIPTSGPEVGIKGMPVEPPAAGTRIRIPVARFSGGELSFEPKDELVAPGGDPQVEAVNLFLRSAGLAEGVRLLSIDLEDGIANLHFGEGFDSGEGSMDEATLIYGIRAVLGQFEDIERIRFFVQGQQIEELGHFEFGDAVPTIPVSRWNDPNDEPDAPTGETPPPSMPR